MPNTFDGTAASFAGLDYAFRVPGTALARIITVATLPHLTGQFE
jgi:hypothetical protein